MPHASAPVVPREWYHRPVHEHEVIGHGGHLEREARRHDRAPVVAHEHHLPGAGRVRDGEMLLPHRDDEFQHAVEDVGRVVRGQRVARAVPRQVRRDEDISVEEAGIAAGQRTPRRAPEMRAIGEAVEEDDEVRLWSGVAVRARREIVDYAAAGQAVEIVVRRGMIGDRQRALEVPELVALVRDAGEEAMRGWVEDVAVEVGAEDESESGEDAVGVADEAEEESRHFQICCCVLGGLWRSFGYSHYSVTKETRDYMVYKPTGSDEDFALTQSHRSTLLLNCEFISLLNVSVHFPLL